MSQRRRLSAIGLVLVAGVVGYFTNALGCDGPLRFYGCGDADRSAADAWQQMPIHGVLATALALAGSRGPRRVASVVATVLLALLSVWAVAVTLGAISALATSTDIGDVALAAFLLALYLGAIVLIWPSN